MSSDITKISEAIEALTKKVNELQEGQGDDLEKEFEMEEPRKRSQMLDIDPETVDSFGDPIQLVTKSRIVDNSESWRIATSFVKREYNNMIGNRYGKHSKIIPVFNDDKSENKIDMVWFAGSNIEIIDINGKQYYKIRLLTYDILTKKLLLCRIPTGGTARQEEIQHVGAGRLGEQWLKEYGGLSPMKPINYQPKSGSKTTMKNVGEVMFES